MLVTLNTEEKEIEKKQHNLVKLELEARDIHDKTELIERKYNEEINNINISHAEDLRELGSKLASASADEQRLNEEIKSVNLIILNFQREHNELVNKLQNNLNATLNVHLPKDAVTRDFQNKIKLEELEDYRY